MCYQVIVRDICPAKCGFVACSGDCLLLSMRLRSKPCQGILSDMAMLRQPRTQAVYGRLLQCRDMEIRFTVTEEDGLNAMRASPRNGWGTFLFVLLLALLFLVGIYLIDH